MQQIYSYVYSDQKNVSHALEFVSDFDSIDSRKTRQSKLSPRTE